MHHTSTWYLSLMITGLLFLSLVFAAYLKWLQPEAMMDEQIVDFQSCLEASGSRVLESYPRMCVSSKGSQFIEDTTIPTNPNPVVLVPAEKKVLTFEDCSQTTGSTIRLSYPSVCVLPDGQSFTQETTLSHTEEASQSSTSQP